MSFPECNNTMLNNIIVIVTIVMEYCVNYPSVQVALLVMSQQSLVELYTCVQAYNSEQNSANKPTSVMKDLRIDPDIYNQNIIDASSVLHLLEIHTSTIIDRILLVCLPYNTIMFYADIFLYTFCLMILQPSLLFHHQMQIS